MTQIEFKYVKKLVPTCPKCEEGLRGNGSIISPYKCSCGTWEYDIEENEYKINKK